MLVQSEGGPLLLSRFHCTCNFMYLRLLVGVTEMVPYLIY